MATWQQGINSGGFLTGIGAQNENAPKASDINATLGLIRENNELARSGANNVGLTALRGLAGVADIYNQEQQQKAISAFNKVHADAWASGDPSGLFKFAQENPAFVAQAQQAFSGLNEQQRNDMGDLAMRANVALSQGPEAYSKFITDNKDRLNRVGANADWMIQTGIQNPEQLTVCKETNMNIVAKSDYNFHGVELVPTRDMHGVWFTSSNIASALKYANSRAVTMIYNKYSDEFSAGMTQVLEVSTSGNYRKKVRVFSLRGAHLIAMFARTPVAKEFRRWVLDILDRQAECSPIAKQFTDEELVNLCYLQLWMEKSQQMCKHIYPGMKQIGSELSGRIYDIAYETRYMSEETKKSLLREMKNLDTNNFVVKNAQPMLAKLRGEEWIH